MRGPALLEWIAAHPVAERDAAVERWLGIDAVPVAHAPLGVDGIGYHPSSVAAIVGALLEARVGADDVFVDLGAGAGKVAALAHGLTGARVLGVEVQPDLVACARAMAGRLGLEGVTFTLANALDADLGAGTVFYLYAPFTGRTLERVTQRLRDEGTRRAVRVCALGTEVRGFTARPTSSFWLGVYESSGDAVSSRPPLDLGPRADDVAHER